MVLPKGLGLEGRAVPGSPGTWTPGKDPRGPGPELGCRDGITVSSHFISSPSVHTLWPGAGAEISPPKLLVSKSFQYCLASISTLHSDFYSFLEP